MLWHFWARRLSCRRRLGRPGVSELPAPWQQRLFPRSGWFRVSQEGVPEPRLLETVRLHLLTEQEQLRALRRVSTCLRTGEALACDERDVPYGVLCYLQDLCASLRARYSLSKAVEDSVRRAGAHARSTCKSAVLTNEQAASIVVMGELDCLAQWETGLSSQSPINLVQQAVLTWSEACPQGRRARARLW